jgi:hypothetical protein
VDGSELLGGENIEATFLTAGDYNAVRELIAELCG